MKKPGDDTEWTEKIKESPTYISFISSTKVEKLTCS